MPAPDEHPEYLRFRDSVHERGSTRLVNLENAGLVIALIATAVHHGLRSSTEQESGLLAAIVLLMAAGISVSCLVRYRWSLRRASFEPSVLGLQNTPPIDRIDRLQCEPALPGGGTSASQQPAKQSSETTATSPGGRS